MTRENDDCKTKKSPRNEPVSLSPLEFEEALRGLLETPPPKDKPATDKQQHRKKDQTDDEPPPKS